MQDSKTPFNVRVVPIKASLIESKIDFDIRSIVRSKLYKKVEREVYNAVVEGLRQRVYTISEAYGKGF